MTGLVAALAVSLALTGVMAATLTEQQVNGKESLYGVSFVGVGNFPSPPAIGAGAIPSTTTTCDASYTGSTGATYYAGTNARLNVGLGPNASCKGGDFAETLTFAAATNAASEVDTFTFVVSWTTANGTAQESSAAMSVDVIGGATTGSGVEFLLDLGSTTPPGSIGGLSIVVT